MGGIWILNRWIQYDWVIIMFNKLSDYIDCVSLVDEIMSMGWHKIYKLSIFVRKGGFRSVKDTINLRYILIKIYGEIMDLDDFTLYVPRTSLLYDLIHSPPTFWLNVMKYRHTPAVKTASEDNYPPKISLAIICIFL